MANGNMSPGPDINMKIRDLEDRQRFTREKLDLISKNFVSLKETLEKEFAGIKVDVESMKGEIEKIKTYISRITEDLENKAKKTDLEILAKQLKMFQPLIQS